MKKVEDLELAGFNRPRTVRLDDEIDKELQKIALFEKKKIGTLMRDWVYEKVRTFRRNPEYKRWSKQFGLVPLKKEKKRIEKKDKDLY